MRLATILIVGLVLGDHLVAILSSNAHDIPQRLINGFAQRGPVQGDLPRSMSMQIDAIASALLGKWLKVRRRYLCLETLGNSSRVNKRAPGRCDIVHPWPR
jgi:hypothetical protein